MEAQSALRSSTWRPKAVQDANLAVQSWSKSPTWRSKRLPKAFRGLSKGPPGLPDLQKPQFYLVRPLFLPFRSIGRSSALGLLSETLFGSTRALWGAIWRALGLPKRLLGCTWRLLDASWSPKEAHLAAQSALGSSTWRPKTLQEANLAVQGRSGSPTWRPKALPGVNLGGFQRSKPPTWRSRA